MPAHNQFIGDAYMDGDYGTDKDPHHDQTRSHLTVTDAAGYWVLDTSNEQTARDKAAEIGGTIKLYDGRDKYRPR